MNKITIFSFIFLMMICGSAWTQQALKDIFEHDIESDLQTNDFCYLISSQDSEMELLFGTFSNFLAVNLPLLTTGTPTNPNDILYDFYFFQDENPQDDIQDVDKPWNIFFTENGKGAQWNLVIDDQCPIPCTLNFKRLSGSAPKNGSCLELYKGETKVADLIDIDDELGRDIVLNTRESYTIKYTPPVLEEESVLYSFHSGWNLLHLPVVVKQDDAGWETLNAFPRMTLSGRTYVQGGEIRCGEAFWVFYVDGKFPNNELTISGYVPLATDWTVRHPGWYFTNTDKVSANTYEWAGRYQVPTSIDSKKGYWIYKTP